MVPLQRWSGYANRGRPDADDDADANEQNMRRHPLSSLRAFGPRSSPPSRAPGIDCRRAFSGRIKTRGNPERKQDHLSG